MGSIDATTLQVLKEPGRKAKTKSYVYCIRGGPPDKSVILYEYNATQHTRFVDRTLEAFKGYMHCDADAFFNLLFQDEAVTPVYCHAHCRRYFEKVKKSSRKPGLARDAMQFYKKLYHIEQQAKTAGLDAEARFTHRQQHSKPLLDQFKQWLDAHYPKVLPQSPLGKAFAYAIKYWDGLNTFLQDGRLQLDNNHTEQEIKPLVIARKNFMFANSVDGANAITLHLSLIRTALLHQLDPYQYYVKLLQQLPHCDSLEDYEALLPWNISI